MTLGKLAWHMNPNVRRTLDLVRQLKDIAYAYHSTSDEQVRNAARRAWGDALGDCLDNDEKSARAADAFAPQPRRPVHQSRPPRVVSHWAERSIG